MFANGGTGSHTAAGANPPDVGTETKFPECARVDSVLTPEDKQTIQSSVGIEKLGLAEVTVDMDSYVCLSENFNALIDSITPEVASVTFSNLVSRTQTNTSSRFKLKHVDIPKPRFFGKENHSTHPFELYPNIPVCKVDLSTGITCHVFLVVLGCTDVRSTNYFTKLQTAVFTSALNYAKGRFSTIGGVRDLFNKSKDMLRRHELALRGLQDFEAKIHRVNEVDHRKPTTSRLEALDGRMFLRCVFAALQEFADDMESVIDRGNLVHQSEFHGIQGTVFTPEEYQTTAKLLVDTGVLVSQAVGTKQVLKNLPREDIDLSDKESFHSFITESASYLRNVIHYWQASDNKDTDAEVTTRQNTGTAVRQSALPNGGRNPDTDPDNDEDNDDDEDEFEVLQANLEDEILETDFEQDQDFPISQAQCRSYLDLQEKLAASVEEFVAVHKNVCGYSVKRETKDVLVFYDIGVNIRPIDVRSSFITNALEAGWIQGIVMSPNRVKGADGTMSVPQVRNDETIALEQLIGGFEFPETEDPRVRRELERQMQLLVAQGSDNPSGQRAVELELQEQLDSIVHNLELQPEGQDVEPILPVGDVDYGEILRQIRNNQAHLYNQLMTNGIIGSSHSGNKTLTVVCHEGTDKLKLMCARLEELSEVTAELVQSFIVGMQIYMPETITLMCKKIRNVHKLLSQFAPLLLILLTKDNISQVYDLEEIWQRCKKLFDEIDHIHARFKRKIGLDVKGMSTRIEFFFQYGTDHDMNAENFAIMPNFAGCIRQVNSIRLFDYLKNQSEESLVPMANLMNSTDYRPDPKGPPPIFNTVMTPETKSRLVYCAEQVALFAEIPYQILPMHKESLNILADPLQKRGCWTAPIQHRLPLPLVTKSLFKIGYGLNKQLLKIELPNCILPYKSSSGGVELQPFLKNYAWTIKKNVRLPLHYAHTSYCLTALLQQYSRHPELAAETAMTLEELLSGEEDNDAPPYSASFVENIDYVYLANTLSMERRDQLFLKMGLLVSRLYDANIHYLLTQKNARSRKERDEGDPGRPFTRTPFPLSDLPCSRTGFENMVGTLNTNLDRLAHFGFSEPIWKIESIETFIQNCFHGGSVPTDGPWKKDPMFNLYHTMADIFSRIKTLIIHNDQEEQAQYSEDAHANSLKPWSKDLLDYTLYKVMFDVRSLGNTGLNDKPILWRTNAWRLTSHLGQPAIFEFNPNNVVGQTVNYNVLQPPILNMKNDPFFTILHAFSPDFPLGLMLVARAILKCYFDELDLKNSWKKLKPSHLTDYIMDMDFGGSKMGYLWDTKEKCMAFVKNHTSSKTGAVYRMECFSPHSFRFPSKKKKTKYLDLTSSYTAGYDLEQIIRYRDMDAEQLRTSEDNARIDYQYWESPDSNMGRELDAHSRNGLQHGIRCASQHLIVTEEFAKALMTYRRKWQLLRTSQANATPEQAKFAESQLFDLVSQEGLMTTTAKNSISM